MKFRLVALAPLAAMAVIASPCAAATAAPNLAGPAILGTQAVPIRADRFADSLRRAREDASGSAMLQSLIAPARQLTPVRQMAFVQTAVTSGIRWMSDATEWGQHDY